MNKEKGSVLIELGIVTPFLVILIFGCIDLFFIIHKNQYLSLAVREAGNTSYRECSEVSTGLPTINCLQNSVQETLDFLSNGGRMTKDAKVIVRSWTVREDGLGNPLPAHLKGEYNDNTYTSKHTFDTVKSLNSYDLDLRETLITVEVYLPPTDAIFFNRTLYETMIF